MNPDYNNIMLAWMSATDSKQFSGPPLTLNKAEI